MRIGGAGGGIFLGVVLGRPDADDCGRPSELTDLLDDVDRVSFPDDGYSALGRVEDDGGDTFYGGHLLHHLPPALRAQQFH